MEKQKTVILVGSSGFLGRCLGERLAPHMNVVNTHHQHQMFSHSRQYDVFQDDLRPWFQDEEVSAVIFAALIEREEPVCVTQAMTRFARSCRNVRTLYLSSDGIFGGEGGEYTEEAIPRPRTQYGQNLLACERLIQQYCQNFCIIRPSYQNFCIIRPSYLYGFSQGILDARLTRIRHALRHGERVDMFEDMYKSPLGVEQVADAVITMTTSDFSGILHVAGPRLSTYEFARQSMEALRVATTHLVPVSMPTDPTWIRDTSLNSMRWQGLTGGTSLHHLGNAISIAGVRWPVCPCSVEFCEHSKRFSGRSGSGRKGGVSSSNGLRIARYCAMLCS